MKQKPMSPKFAATALLLAATGALLPASPAQAATLNLTTTTPTITDTLSKYNLNDFLNPTATATNWAVTYTPSVPVADQSEAAAHSLLTISADQALAQKTATEMQAAAAQAAQVAQQQADETKALKAAAREKIAAQQAAADAAKAAADKAAADKAAADAAAADKIAADKAAQVAQQQAVQAASAAPTTQATQPAAAVTAQPTITTPAAAPAPVTGTTRQQIVQLANQFLGVPYVWGGSTPSGWDCSGFVQYIARQAGVSLPRTATAQMTSGLLTRTSNPQPGDFVFFTEGGSAYHVGIYIGGGMMIHAPVPGQNTQVSAVWGTPTYMTLNG